MTQLIVNGKHYPLWSQFITKKQEWVGGELFDFDMGLQRTTKIKDIVLAPNGETSAFFSVIGEEFSSGFDVKYGGITGGTRGLTFSGYGGHRFSIKKVDE